MLLQDSQGRSPHFFKNRWRINIPIVVWEYEGNIQPISQCYAGIFIILPSYSEIKSGHALYIDLFKK